MLIPRCHSAAVRQYDQSAQHSHTCSCSAVRTATSKALKTSLRWASDSCKISSRCDCTVLMALENDVDNTDSSITCRFVDCSLLMSPRCLSCLHAGDEMRTCCVDAAARRLDTIHCKDTLSVSHLCDNLPLLVPLATKGPRNAHRTCAGSTRYAHLTPKGSD